MHRTKNVRCKTVPHFADFVRNDRCLTALPGSGRAIFDRLFAADAIDFYFQGELAETEGMARTIGGKSTLGAPHVGFTCGDFDFSGYDRHEMADGTSLMS